ncbi:glycosyltransferase [Ponticoccus gilvus]|nr:glycosyltransferase [Enemella evansiae]
MLRRLRGVFDRYCAQSLLIERPGRRLDDPAGGASWGAVESLARRGNRIEVTGWVRSPGLRLVAGEEETAVTVSPAPGIAAPGGRFRLDIPASTGPLALHLSDRAAPVFDLPGIPARAVARARRALLPCFGLRLLRATPLILAWVRRRDPALRPRIRAALGFWGLPPARALRADLFAASDGGPPPAAAAAGVTIVLPVYNAFDLLTEALDRVLRHTDLPWHLVMIEDASPDPAVRPFLRDWTAAREAEAPGRVTLLENDTNLGFVGSVNRGLAVALARGGPVVLLNSDALVPPGWAGRLLAPILRDPGVASTTPMSNDAEIFSVPVIAARCDLAPGQGDALDALAQGFAPGAGDRPAPTGVGFCMGLSGGWLARVPAFDTAFGRGYGEEVDWCQKVRALGGRHLGVAGLFVEHRGGSSFGQAEKQILNSRNAGRISARYPSYDMEVQDHLLGDPMVTPRLALGLGWLAGQAGEAPVPVYLSHALGGGVARYLGTRIAADIAARRGAVVLRVGTGARWRLELHAATGVTRGETDDFALVQRLLSPLRHRLVSYVCGVGDHDPMSLPDRLLDLAAPEGGRARLEVMFHDFYPLSPSFTLLDASGAFHGVPAPDDPDPAHALFGPLRDWRAAWGRVMARTDRAVAFSQDSRAHVLTAWPDLADRLEVVPHRLTHPVPRLVPAPGPRPVLAVLGNLNLQKGYRVVREMGRLCGSEDPELVHLGELDPACAPPPGVLCHGAFRPDDLGVLARRHRITGWLIPSVWPETFSFTTHEALTTGLPVFCLDLGAQAEALRAAGAQGHVVPLHASPEAQARAVLAAARAALAPG